MQAQVTIQNYFVLWPADTRVRFWYQDYLTAMASDFSDRSGCLPTAIGGLIPLELDPGAFVLLMNDDSCAESLRFFESENALLIPATVSGQAAYVLVSRTVPLHPALETHLTKWGIVQEFRSAEHARYLIPPGLGEQWLAKPVTFSALYDPKTPEPLATLLDVEPLGVAGQTLTLLTYWRLNAPSLQQLRIFVHLVDTDGNLVAQNDTLGAPSTKWRSGDLLIQAHDIAIPPDITLDSHHVRIGLYDPTTGIRLVVGDPPVGDAVDIMLTPSKP
jgi:hypothetical protein